ncbi:unnamed protein product [Clonostachys rhizophaga]|uniref:Phenacrylate decarboxylase n=1 Tax=Clonostachys rhizophaga TaxID=160324 RepID=A0A9N9W0L4_9HYPO|nr:unnamed protein product [Clonostachys rhizophaga]
MFGNAASLRSHRPEKYGRIARSLGLPADSSWKDILERSQVGKAKPKVGPHVISTGPCKQTKIFGDEIDLNKLPAPMLHQADGGKYLQTYGVHILQAPDASWTNWSIFRGMIHDSRRLVCLVGSGQHNSIIRDKWLKEGATEIPWALAMGVPPAVSLAAACPIPEGVSEGEYVGALVGEPLENISLEDKAYEGPFEDYLGLHFDDDDKHLQPLFTVNAITYRDDAILPVSVPGRISDESHTTASLASEEFLELCKEHNLPVIDPFAPLEMHATWCALKIDTNRLAKEKTNSQDFCSKLGQIAFNDKSCMLINRILLFGHDVDIRQFDDIIWALVTRCRPGRDEYVFEDVPGFPLTPYMSHGSGDARRGGKAISDCLFPMEYKGKRAFSGVDFEKSYPKEIKDKVRANWSAMGFESL